jgi:hypothetical protein
MNWSPISLLSMGAVFGMFAGFYYWIGKITGLQYPETLGQIHFWMSAPLCAYFRRSRRSECALELSALKQLLLPLSKGIGNQHGVKRYEMSALHRKVLASYDPMDRLTNLIYYSGLSQEGSVSLAVKRREEVTRTSVVRVSCKFYTESPLLSGVMITFDHKNSRVLRDLIGNMQTLGLPKAGNSYGNRGSIVLTYPPIINGVSIHL